MGYLNNDLPDQHPFHGIRLVPEDGGVPQFWMLGSSGGSAEVAGQLGSGFVLALFIGTHARSPAIVEAFTSMQEDLDREKKAITKQWAKREEQIDQAMQATAGIYGDLQGIAGKAIQEIEGLELITLEAVAQGTENGSIAETDDQDGRGVEKQHSI